MNLWIWPFTTGLASAIAFVPGAGLTVNLQHWLAFSIATSLAFDIPRAILAVVLISILGKPALAVLRRAGRRAVFDAGTLTSVDVSRV
jgi:energy-coupling factor transport system substrate-specific component